MVTQNTLNAFTKYAFKCEYGYYDKKYNKVICQLCRKECNYTNCSNFRNLEESELRKLVGDNKKEKCPKCGREVNKGNNPYYPYCSAKCAHVCFNCGKKLPEGYTRVYCSDECKREFLKF